MKFKGMLICTDLDGTLLREDRSLSAENLQAMEYFKAEGGYFTFITGRMPYYSQDYCAKIQPNAPFGCINGGGVFDPESNAYRWTQPLDPLGLQLAEEVADRVGVGVQVNTFYKTWFCRENSTMKKFRGITGVPNSVCGFGDFREPLSKIIFGVPTEELYEQTRRAVAAHPLSERFTFVRSEKEYYELLPKGIDKGVALRKLAETLGVEMSNTVAIGDYNNDIGMLRAAGLGVAVANATPETKAAADWVTVSNEEHAMVHLVEHLEKRIR